MNRIIITVVFFLFCFTLGAQENKVTNIPTATSMQLRPNSKDVVPVRRSNLHERMEVRKRAAYMQQQRLKSLNSKRKIKPNPPHSRQNISNQQRMVRQRMLRQRALQQRRSQMRRR